MGGKSREGLRRDSSFKFYSLLARELRTAEEYVKDLPDRFGLQILPEKKNTRFLIRVELAAQLDPTEYELIIYTWSLSRFLIWINARGLPSLRGAIDGALRDISRKHRDLMNMN